MPVVLRIKDYRFEFYASDNDEPPHIHVKKNGKRAKFWLTPVVALEYSQRFRPHELNEAMKLVHEHRERFLEAWNGFFGRRA
jgi:hypothetical protein